LERAAAVAAATGDPVAAARELQSILHESPSVKGSS
jgi:hypothetical protein